MKIHNIRFGFATNSSSSHSIIMLRPGHTVTELRNDSGGRYGEYQFGWEVFRLTDADEKTKYVISQFVSNLRGSGDLNFYEVQKLVTDLFGVELSEEEFGDMKYPDIYVDHQSVITMPTDSTDFWKAFHKFALRDDVVILGGNDNGGDIPDGYVPFENDQVEWLRQITDRRGEMRVRQEGDVWVFFNKDNGTKTRVSLTNEADFTYTKASTPELVDLKITDYCPMGCKFCYQGSTKNGVHAPKEKIYKIIRQLKKLGVFEIAIGGGEPTMHPDFANILRYARKNGIVPNFTTYSLAWLKDEKILKAVGKYAGGVGVSVHSLKDIKKFKEVSEAVSKVSEVYYRQQVMAQHVLGTLSMAETAEMFEFSMENYVPLLVLGYKDVGFGGNVVPQDFTDFPTVLKLAIKDTSKWCQISVDTAVLQQHPDLLKVLEVSELLATSEEGKFSCYIDAVTGEMGPSSYAPGQMSILPTSYRGITKLFATY